MINSHSAAAPWIVQRDSLRERSWATSEATIRAVTTTNAEHAERAERITSSGLLLTRPRTTRRTRRIRKQQHEKTTATGGRRSRPRARRNSPRFTKARLAFGRLW